MKETFGHIKPISKKGEKKKRQAVKEEIKLFAEDDIMLKSPKNQQKSQQN